ncbi:DEDD exonuclease domain-containing protein [Nocardioides jishulii]|uniref:DEDD exonuclease domain-containing protein n=1 Tax=Nocardioides jishulii TaxID=2575440 RepID=A0A4V5TR22_9ACTN|nr:DEDD exonuclease domain-containing protein [Nocardioides jishulii]QCX27129.1 DEDD exonuclease domain-containing protein [Nocardioides jishulii]TKI61613.1 DEDD exonuclease domain-containing protein [Nocardioides jishulii]
MSSTTDALLHPGSPAPSSGNTSGTTSERRWEQQLGLDDLGRPLSEVTFTVVDLETTGGSPAGGSMITEIGAVKVRGGEVLGEFQTLVNPHAAIPPFIAVLTGITDAMVATAPPIESALPAFLEFAAGSVLVAHNAPFDVGFLKHFAEQQQRPWPSFEVLDTVKLARRVVTRDETPNCKLSSLATLFRASVTPDHRALSDARATVDVMHGLFARLGGQGLQTLEDVQSLNGKVTDAQRRKRHLAEDLPTGPGVYLFRGARDEVLYVGTSRHVRKRVRTYFTASETRSRMSEMVTLAERVQAVECSTALEAQVRELRLIASHRPHYNRRSKFPDKHHFLTLTAEPWPRLSLVRSVKDRTMAHLGPFSSRRTAERALAALHEAYPIRQCTQRLGRQPTGTPCALAEMGRCLSPCDGSADATTYAAVVESLASTLVADPTDVVEALEQRMRVCAEDERFEEAGTHRDRLGVFVRSAARSQRLRALVDCAELVAARREDDGRWAVHVLRHGRLSAAGVIPPRADANTWVDNLVASAETVVDSRGALPASSAEECDLVLRWLEQPGVRLVRAQGEWTCPTRGAEGRLALISAIDKARDAGVPSDERGLPRTVARPTR